MLLFAHPLHANGRAGQSARDQGRIGRRIVRTIVAITARALHMDAANA